MSHLVVEIIKNQVDGSPQSWSERRISLIPSNGNILLDTDLGPIVITHRHEARIPPAYSTHRLDITRFSPEKHLITSELIGTETFPQDNGKTRLLVTNLGLG